MTEVELLKILAQGEDSRHQFKREAHNADSMAAELAALANSGGGYVFLGVGDDGQIIDLNAADVRRINQLLSNSASQHVRPPIHPITDNIRTEHGIVMVITISDGLSKPYIDNQGRIWVKSGSDKRHVTAREEIQRLFQRTGLVYADVIPVTGTSGSDIDEKAFAAYFEHRYNQTPGLAGQSLSQLLQNLGLGDGCELNLAGLMLFSKHPQRYRPAFEVKAVAFPGVVLHDSRYLDSEDIGGTLLEQYQRSFAFIRRNLRHVQADQGFNTLGQLEIPEQALEELLVNALIHRDYFTSASIRLMVFVDRVEIISPGHLPDSLNTEAIRLGATNRRNPTLTEHAIHILPYRGLGTGIPRALHDWPNIELLDEMASNQFKVVIPRLSEAKDKAPPQVTPQVNNLLAMIRGEHTRAELMKALGLKDRKHFRMVYLQPALDAGLLDMSIPDKPNSRLQKYRITEQGQALLISLRIEPHPP